MMWLTQYRFLPPMVWALVGLGVLYSDLLLPTGVLLFLGAARTFTTRRIPVDAIGQLIAALFLAAIVYGIMWWRRDTVAVESTGIIGRAGAMYCVALVISRCWMKRPVGLDVGTAVLLLSVWLFLGMGTSSGLYLALCGPGVLLVFWAAQAPGQVPRGVKHWRFAGMGALIVLAGLGIAAVLVVAIPRAHSWATARFIDSMSFSVTGFSPVLAPGEVRQMYVSDKVVMRVFTAGRRPLLLRAQVYNHWNGHFWTNSIARTVTPAAALRSNAKSASAGSVASVRFVSRSSRFYVPLNLMGVDAGVPVRVDNMGMVSLFGSTDVDEYRFQTTQTIPPHHVAAPVVDDLAIPSEMRATLMHWIQNHVPAKGNPAQKLAAIESELASQYEYSLTFSRPKNQNALIDFLIRNKKGHCEYFASAFALLARAVGVPSRVVGGYRMSEHNSLGEYFIVREKHAHAWVEVWLNNSWRTMDPTPGRDDGQLASGSNDVLDALWVWMSQGMTTLTTGGKWVLGGSILGLLMFWAAIRWFRRRRQGEAMEESLAYQRPHLLAANLESRLSAVLPRPAHETLEDWAARLLASDASLDEPVKLLLEYARWRYGNTGDIQGIALRIARLK